MQNRFIVAVLLFFLVLLTPSCGTMRPIPKGAKTPAELSSKLGFKVTSKDNLLLYTEVADWLGTKHNYGGSSKKGVDCSGLVVQVYDKVYDKKLKRSSADMLKYNCHKVRKGSLREGDLVFFRTSAGNKKIPNHVGIYLKDKYFVHTSSSKGVVINKVTDNYYDKCWITGGKVK